MLGHLSFAAVLGVILALPQAGDARVFRCRSGDVACLIASIRKANVRPGSRHEIRLATGTYTVTEVDNDTDGPNGLPSITGQLTIRGAGADMTILERNVNAAPFRLFHVAATGALTLDGLTLRGGIAPYDGRLFNRGGGLFNNGGVLHLMNTHLTENYALAEIFADSATGGALFNGGGVVHVVDSRFTYNGAAGRGGAIDTAGGVVHIVNTLFFYNSAWTGAFGGDQERYGGGLWVRDGAEVTIMHTTFRGNSARDGGGLKIESGASVSIGHTTIAENGALYVGGGFDNEGMLTISNSTVTRNAAGNGVCGGGYSGGLTLITNATIADNWADAAVGGLCGGELRNSMIARNTRGSDIPDDCSEVISHGHNLVGHADFCPSALLASDLTDELGLGEFTDDGMPGHGHVPLLLSSQAIDAGDDATCPPTDQLGQARVDVCDIGAIEFQGESFAATVR